jgi:hypothetical protein
MKVTMLFFSSFKDPLARSSCERLMAVIYRMLEDRVLTLVTKYYQR